MNDSNNNQDEITGDPEGNSVYYSAASSSSVAPSLAGFDMSIPLMTEAILDEPVFDETTKEYFRDLLPGVKKSVGIKFSFLEIDY